MSRAERRQILEIAIPVSIESSFQVFLGFVNQVIIAVLGTVAIASVGLANNVLFIGVLCMSAVGSGVGILVSQAWGRSDRGEIGELTWVGLLAGGGLGVVVAGPLVLWSEGFLVALGTSPDVVASAGGYLRLVLFSIPAVAMSAGATGVFRAIGKVRLATSVAIVTGLVGSVMSWVLVRNLGMGEVGAGVGLVVAQYLKVGVLVMLLAGRRHGVGFRLPSPAVARQELGRLFPLVMPLFVTEIVFSGGMFVYALLFERLGTAELAVFQIVNAIEGVFVVGILGFHAASTVLVARAVGAADIPRVWGWSNRIWRLAVKAALGLALLFVATIPLLPAFYPKTTTEVLGWAAAAIIANALFLPVKASNIFLFGTLAAGGDTRFLLWSDVVTMMMVGLPLGYLLGLKLGFGLWGIFAARLLGEETSRVLMLGARFRGGKWFPSGPSPGSAVGEMELATP